MAKNGVRIAAQGPCMGIRDVLIDTSTGLPAYLLVHRPPAYPSILAFTNALAGIKAWVHAHLHLSQERARHMYASMYVCVKAELLVAIWA